MSKYTERKKQIIDNLKAFVQAADLENKEQMDIDIILTLNKSVDEALLSICANQLHFHNITTEMKKYLIGKIYKTELATNKCRNHEYYISHDQHYNQRCMQIAYKIGQEYGFSAATVCKYRAYASAVDSFLNRKSISAVDILSGKEKIPFEYISKLLKMADPDIGYLKYLFDEDYYKLAGYIFIGGESSVPRRRPKTRIKPAEALIKQMPKHDPDVMITSLSLTISSWINSIQKTIKLSDIDEVSENAKLNLYIQLNDLKNVISKTLIVLEEKYNG